MAYKKTRSPTKRKTVKKSVKRKSVKKNVQRKSVKKNVQRKSLKKSNVKRKSIKRKSVKQSGGMKNPFSKKDSSKKDSQDSSLKKVTYRDEFGQLKTGKTTIPILPMFAISPKFGAPVAPPRNESLLKEVTYRDEFGQIRTGKTKIPIIERKLEDFIPQTQNNNILRSNRLSFSPGLSKSQKVFDLSKLQ